MIPTNLRMAKIAKTVKRPMKAFRSSSRADSSFLGSPRESIRRKPAITKCQTK